MKEIEEDTNRWKDIPHSWIGRINTVTMTILAKVIYRLSAIPIKIPVAFFTELEQIISKFVQKPQRPQILKTRRTELDGSCFLTSDYTTNLQ